MFRTSVSEMFFRGVGISVVILPTEELLVMRIVIVPCDLKKSVMWSCVLDCCYNGVVGKNMFLAVVLIGGPVIL